MFLREPKWFSQSTMTCRTAISLPADTGIPLFPIGSDPRGVISGRGWIDLAQDRVRLRALVNAVMILWVP